MEQSDNDRLERLQQLADTVLEKLCSRVEEEMPMKLEVQTLKHITGLIKDLKDIHMSGRQTDNAGQITVVFEGDMEALSE